MVESSKKPEDDPEHGPSYRVNDRKGRVRPPSETLPGKEILQRVQLSFERYQLFTLLPGEVVGPEILPDQLHEVKPGDRFRATIRGTDYSFARVWP